MNISIFVVLTAVGLSQSAENNLSCSQIRKFVDGHNIRRLQIAQGKLPGQPAAENMKFMIWDEELAEMAYKWASQHKFSHNPKRILSSGRFSVGENLMWTASSNLNYPLDPDSAMNAWFVEHKNYKYGPLKPEQFNGSSKQIGHYTQMAWADSTHLGCGISSVIKNGLKNYYVVCNYGPSGNFLTQTPYKSSKTGSNKLFCGSYNCTEPYGKSCPK